MGTPGAARQDPAGPSLCSAALRADSWEVCGPKVLEFFVQKRGPG